MSSYARAGEGAAVKLATDAAAAATAEDKKERRENAGVSATEWREGGGVGRGAAEHRQCGRPARAGARHRGGDSKKPESGPAMTRHRDGRGGTKKERGTQNQWVARTEDAAENHRHDEGRVMETQQRVSKTLRSWRVGVAVGVARGGWGDAIADRKSVV